MEPQRITGGHFGSPDGDPDYPGYEEVYRLAPVAERGVNVLQFHTALAQHIATIDKAGGHGSHRKIGGQTPPT